MSASEELYKHLDFGIKQAAERWKIHDKELTNQTLDAFVAELEKVINEREQGGGHPVIVRSDLYETAKRMKGEDGM